MKAVLLLLGLCATLLPATALGQEIGGLIRLSEGQSAEGVLFVMGRPAGVAAGPPAAVRRFEVAADEFPLPFTLSEAHSMLGGPLPEMLDLSVRLDADGDPMTRGPQDLVASIEGIPMGTGGLMLTLESAGAGAGAAAGASRPAGSGAGGGMGAGASAAAASGEEIIPGGPDPSLVVGPPIEPDRSEADAEALADSLATRMRCPVCQGLAVADSPSDSAVNMYNQIRRMASLGYGEEQIFDYFEASYGSFVRLEPRFTGFSLLVWLLPVGVGLLGLGLVVRAGQRQGRAAEAPAEAVEVPASLQPFLEQVRAETRPAGGRA